MVIVIMIIKKNTFINLIYYKSINTMFLLDARS